MQVSDQSAISVDMMETSAMQMITEIHSIVKWMMQKKSIMEMFAMLLIQVKPFDEYLYPNECKFYPLFLKLTFTKLVTFFQFQRKVLRKNGQEIATFQSPTPPLAQDVISIKLIAKDMKSLQIFAFVGPAYVIKKWGPCQQQPPPRHQKCLQRQPRVMFILLTLVDIGTEYMI